jgi:hypothetical protein
VKRTLRETKGQMHPLLADELGVQPTDVMFWKLPGSFEGGRR